MKIYHNVDLSRVNSLGVQSMAEEVARPEHVNELIDALSTSKPITVLGSGTNVVLREFIPGRVVSPNLRGISWKRVSKDHVHVRAGAGENWHELVRTTLGRGFAGLENLSLIPGSVGAAPFQNIGAYGRDLSQFIDKVEVVDRKTLEVHQLTRTECKFRYRGSIFRKESLNRFVITHVRLNLPDLVSDTKYTDVVRMIANLGFASNNAIHVAEAVIRIRRTKLPDLRKYGNIGSFFKNPSVSFRTYDRIKSHVDINGIREGHTIKIPAARLIDCVGFKGRIIGKVGVWYRQPLVLFNADKADGTDFLNVAKQIADAVYQKYEVELQLEPTVIGQDKQFK